ncbi:unnamed protein product [Sphagnum balticum]
MADVMDVAPGPLLREDRRRDRSAERKDRTLEDRKRDREAREEREDRPPRREHNHEKKSSQERLGGGDRRERDRDYKRRKSPTSPAYRDRRHSPPLHRSPGYKRFRRHDEFEGGRRGAAVEETGRRTTGFLGDGRLREKYDPARLEAVLLRRNENAKILAKELLAELQGGSLDVGPSARGSAKEESEDDGDVGAKGRRQSRSTKKSQEINAAPKAPAGSADPKRVVKDIELCRSVIRKLDSEKGIEGNILAPVDQQNGEGDRSISTGSVGPIVIMRSGNHQVKGLEGIELLDVMLTYMWRVHSVDYYGMVELKEPPRRLRHIRGTVDPKNGGEDPGFVAKVREELYFENYMRNLTDIYTMIIIVQISVISGEGIVLAIVTGTPLTRPVFSVYDSDADAPGTTQAVSSHPGQTGFLQILLFSLPVIPGLAHEMVGIFTRGQEFGMMNHNFDRGGREEEPQFDRGAPEHSPGPHDFPPLGGGAPPYKGGGQPQAGPFEGDPLGAPMFDHFNGPPMRGLPGGLFVPDMPGPPQVLMPVPGAGPLGPFVPAPPEMAMQFVREGPAPFHPGAFIGGFDGGGNGMARGHKRLPIGGPMMGGGVLDVPHMMMPPPHAMHSDPRSVRSYRDLDAPEDEVTVIDYRSL